MPGTRSRSRSTLALLAGALVAGLLLSGCAVHHHDGHRGRAVRAHDAPRHGHEYRHLDVVLLFDRSWNGYRVRGRPHHYFHRNSFYRWRGGRWYRAHRWGGPWTTIGWRGLPHGLASHHPRAALQERRPVRPAGRSERRHDGREARDERRDVRREERREARREDHREARRE
jgi:hypothetical protein